MYDNEEIEDWYWDKASHEFARQMTRFLFQFIDYLEEMGLSKQFKSIQATAGALATSHVIMETLISFLQTVTWMGRSTSTSLNESSVTQNMP